MPDQEGVAVRQLVEGPRCVILPHVHDVNLQKGGRGCQCPQCLCAEGREGIANVHNINLQKGGGANVHDVCVQKGGGANVHDVCVHKGGRGCECPQCQSAKGREGVQRTQMLSLEVTLLATLACKQKKKHAILRHR
eukprot:1156636-Pelagomonas_calceolata.AAC.5